VPTFLTSVSHRINNGYTDFNSFIAEYCDVQMSFINLINI